jgi:hypothetical protein
VRTRLWTWWDTVTLVVYEAWALPVAFFVHGEWQFPVFIAGLVALFLVSLASRNTDRSKRLRASIPQRTGSAPFLVSILAVIAVTAPVGLVIHALGADHSDGWLFVSLGGLTPALQVTDRWWTARVGTAT